MNSSTTQVTMRTAILFIDCKSAAHFSFLCTLNCMFIRDCFQIGLLTCSWSRLCHALAVQILSLAVAIRDMQWSASGASIHRPLLTYSNEDVTKSYTIDLRPVRIMEYKKLLLKQQGRQVYACFCARLIRAIRSFLTDF